MTDNSEPSTAPTFLPQELGDGSAGNPFKGYHIFSLVGFSLVFVATVVLIVVSMLFPRSISFVRNTGNHNLPDGFMTPEQEKKNNQERKTNIKKWLRTSQVVQHHFLPEDGQLPTSPDSMEEEQEVNNDNEGTQESSCCQICMEEWQIGDLVAYSGRHCHHVFHFDCIESWLMKHIDCPYCRQIMLTVDENDFAAAGANAELDDLGSADLTFCACHGLQVIERHHNETDERRKESEQLHPTNVVMASLPDSELSTMQTVDDPV